MGAVATTNSNTLPAVPAYMAAALKVLGTGANAMVKAGLRGDFQVPPTVSIRGKVFRLKVDGNETPLQRRDEDNELVAVSALRVIVLAANKGKYKTFYGSKYVEGQEGEAPKCYSYDGERPSPFAEEPQCKSCAACPHNVWGSVTTDEGNKSRACSDNKILAVLFEGAVQKKLPADDGGLLSKVYRLQVSPTAMNRSKADRKAAPNDNYSLSEYVELLDNYPVGGGQSVEVPISSAVTRLFFDGKAAYPKLQFKFAGFLEEDQLEYVRERAAGDDVKLIIEDRAPADAGKVDEDSTTGGVDFAKLNAEKAAKAAADKAMAEAVAKAEADAKAAAAEKSRKAAAADDGGFEMPGEAAKQQATPAPEPATKRTRTPKAAGAEATAAAAVTAKPEVSKATVIDDSAPVADAAVDATMAEIADMFLQ